ncbi:MAG: glycosyltransferase [Flavobacteriales bacterium]|nr:MAG: glycosyltransferase [Flavobacteriales bacterium]
MAKHPQLSVIIPFLNEIESLPELYPWIVRTLEKAALSFELILIDDGSTDSSWSWVEEIAENDKRVLGIRFLRNYGKSQALHAGFLQCNGDVVCTMDADLQDSPEELPDLYRLITDDDYDMVSGWKKKRYDSILFKNTPSKIFNWAARRVSGIKLHDFNCGLKAYRSDLVKTIEVYGEMHRYIPVLAKQAGFIRIGEKVVRHQARKFGHSKFGPERFVKGFLDLITLWFLHRFGRRPMYIFGLIGSIMLLLGFSFAIYLGFDKLFVNPSGRLIADRPQFYVALTTMILGSQFFLAGFIGEIIVRNRDHKLRYKIKETISPNSNGNT